MEEQAQTLLATLRKSSVAVDTKLALFNNLKSSIKHLRVPDGSQAPIFDCIKLAIGSQTSSSLVNTGFSTLGHFVKRLHLQDQGNVIASQSPKLFPILLDRLGDARESYRNAASQSLSDLWPICHAEVERIIRDGALTGTNARGKEMAMLWVVKMHESKGLPFRTFVPHLVACLEDSDGGVRETAKAAVVELFRTAPDHAKMDLKKQLSAHNVRKTIATHILSQLGMAGSVDVDLKASTISVSTMPTDHHRPHHANDHHRPDAGFGNSVASEHPPLAEPAPIDPMYVHTQRELDDIFREMIPHFEGKETEQNWGPRDKSVLKLRRLTNGNAPTEFHNAFVAGIKSLLDGILKVANSLRTTMSTNGCQLVQELARALGPALDPMTEVLLQTFIKMSAATKQIAAQNGGVTVDTIFHNASYNVRLMQHVWLAFQDKNVQPRTYASGWLKTLIRKHAHQKSLIEHSGGLELAEKSIKKGLADAHPKVREAVRGTYWVFAQTWPDRAEAIMDALDAKSKQLLQKDPNNPNASSFAASVSSNASTAAKLRSVPSRSSLKDSIAAQKKAAMAAKKMPDRPTSAMSTSPVRQPSSASLNTRPQTSHGNRIPTNASSSTASRQTPVTGATSGSLMSAPVRRPRRPELARPATADPYASRRAAKAVTPTGSPTITPTKDISVEKPNTIRRSPAAKSQSSTSPVQPTLRTTASGELPRIEKSRTESPGSSPSKEENLTMVLPFTRTSSSEEPAGLPFRRRPGIDKTMSVDSGIPSIVEDDGFTMVLPNMILPRPSEPVLNTHISPRKAPSPQPSPSKTLRDGSSFNITPPRGRSPPRPRGRSPLSKSTSHDPNMLERWFNGHYNDEVKVYEDPMDTDYPNMPETPEPKKAVLEELPLNERHSETHPTTPNTNLNDSPNTTLISSRPIDSPLLYRRISTGSDISGTSRENEPFPPYYDPFETLRSQRLIGSGIERIRARTLDAHGFRRVQDLVRSKNPNVWTESSDRFTELLTASLEYLEAPSDSLKVPAAKAQNSKTQALGTVRALLTVHRKHAEPHYARALCSLIKAKGMHDPTSYIAIDFENTAEEIVKHCDASECLNAVLDLVDNTAPSPPSTSDSNGSSTEKIQERSRTTAFALSILAQLLQNPSARNTPLSASQTQRFGQMAVRFLSDLDADVRRADLEFCLQLHERLQGGKEGFWKAVVGAKEGQLNLITYYLARRGKAQVAG